MSRSAIYPGSFDPITLGHTDVIERSMALFERFYIAIGTNTSKKYLFDLDTRLAMLKSVYANNPKVEIIAFEGLTVDLCKKLDCKVMVRGVRSTTDMEYERAIADSNKVLSPNLESIFLLSSPTISHISSSIVRELIRNKADVSAFVPKPILSFL